MDELRQAVQNASYEQKDPLLIYKFESYNLFSSMIAKTNEAIVSYLFKAQLSVYKETNEKARLAERRQNIKLEESKQDFLSQLYAAGTGDVVEKPNQPIKSNKIDRNQRVTVQYQDGTIKEDVKFKSVEEDIASDRCVLVEDK